MPTIILLSVVLWIFAGVFTFLSGMEARRKELGLGRLRYSKAPLGLLLPLVMHDILFWPLPERVREKVVNFLFF